MTDIVERLRREVVWESDVGDLLNAAADEIERLRGDAEVARLRLDAAHAEVERLRQSDRLQPVEPADATPDTHATPIEGSVQGRCTLTDAEREAIEAAIAYLQPVGNYDNRVQNTLRNLLERHPSASSR